MKNIKHYVVLLFFFLCFNIVNKAQNNLVPNYSFEDISSCPHDQGTYFISYCLPWFSPNGNTPDFYNSCDNNVTTSDSGLGVPYNWSGYQQAHTGIGYAGIAWELSDDCDYLSVKLISPLKVGGKYCISFYVNPGNYTYYVIDRIGAYISLDSIHASTYGYLHYIPQIENPAGAIISDTVNWTNITGQYIASGGEQFITIGCFRPDSMVQIAYGDTIDPPGMWPYYFLDDVSVYECDDTTGINEIEKKESDFKIYPDPVIDIANIDYSINTAKAELKVFSITGKEIANYELNIKDTHFTFNTGQLNAGIYFYQVIANGEKLSYNKFIIIK